MNIRVYCEVQRFRRSVNGAWMSGGWSMGEPADLPEDRARARAFYTPLAGITTLEWPDGHRETFSHNSSLHLTGPGDSRLLPEALRRPGGTWYLADRKVYYWAPGATECEVLDVPPVQQPEV